MTYRDTKSLACLTAIAFLAVACKEDPPPRREPPPPAAKPATCSAKGRANDPANVKFLPASTSGYCLDPAGSDKGYGDNAKNPLDGICDLFDGECEIYKGFGVKRVVEAHYVDGKGSAATIDVYLSTYDSTENAYGMFTKRVVGEGDPAHEDAPRPLEVKGAAGLGVGNAYLWRGQFMAEVTYNDGQASAKQIHSQADKLLPKLVNALADKLPGKPALPPAAAALPTDKRLPLGTRFITKKMLRVEGTGAGAYGYYADGDKRWRVLSIVKPDVDQAKDVLRTFGKVKGAAVEKDVGDHATRFMSDAGGPQTEWIVAQKGARVLGVGDESRVLRDGMSPGEHGKLTLSQDAKRELLKKLLQEM
jgi:hypothetical protein